MLNMIQIRIACLASLLLCLCVEFVTAGGVFAWQTKDQMNDLNRNFMNKVHDYNCAPMSKADLLMRDDIVTQLPRANELRSKVFYKNRTALVHLHNMAYNRAYFITYILQRMNSSRDYHIQPNIHYLYMSVTADINAHPNTINGSSIIFDENVYYPNWLTTIDYNNTIPFFGVKGWRFDNTSNQETFMREPNRRVVFVEDIGTGSNNNYTLPKYKMNPWYQFWLPDLNDEDDKSNKFTYSVGIKYSKVTGEFIKEEFEMFNFFGPNQPSQNEKDITKMPVRFTVPYFDCGKSDVWKVSVVAAIVDFFPRYTNYTWRRRQRFVGVISMDINYLEIDFNPCGISEGNPGPSFLAGISRCKPHSECRPKSGKGFRRGAYTCHCENNYFYPLDVEGPYDGRDIENATKMEYNKGFNCLGGDHNRVLPVVDHNAEVTVEFGASDINARKKGSLLSINEMDYIDIKHKKIEVDSKNKFKDFEKKGHKVKAKRRHKRSADYADWSEFDQNRFDRMMEIFRQKASINKDNCKNVAPTSLHLPGDAAYDVENQFQFQGETALRLSHFLSLFLQAVQKSDDFGNLRGVGRLHQDHLFGEVLANVMADHRILSSGIFFEPHLFENQDGTSKEFFGPFAFKEGSIAKAIDMAGLQEKYIHETWYLNIKTEWNTNTSKLQEYKTKPMVRSDEKGTSSVKFEYFPSSYYAPSYKDGLWSNPIFKCDGMVDAWVVTYSVAFFRRDYVEEKTKFAGVITVDVPLDNLEINQCPQPFNVSNAFKNTARCHSKSSRCSAIPGYKYSRGAYRCDCKQGYEYFSDGKYFIEGNLIELEYEKKIKGLYSRLDSLVCRIRGGASLVSISYVTICIGVLLSSKYSVLS